jgi:hypothetical protein
MWYTDEMASDGMLYILRCRHSSIIKILFEKFERRDY